MAKKHGFFSLITDVLLKSTLANVKDSAEEIMDKAQQKALVLQERLVQRLIAACTMLLACLFFLAALTFYLTQDLMLRDSQAFALIGLALVALTFFFKYRALAQDRR